MNETQIEAVRAAERAKQILNDPLFEKACQDVEQRSYEELLKLPYTDADVHRKRAELIDRINVIRSVKSELQAAIVKGWQAERAAPKVA